MKLYLPNTGASAVNPGFDASWEQTGEADRIRWDWQKQNTTLTDRTVTVPITTTQDILARQYVSDPLPYGARIGNNVQMVVRGLESATSANAFLAFVLRIVAIDGTAKSTICSRQTTTGATEFTASAQTRIWTNLNPDTNQTALASDRLVLEIGVRANAPTAAQTATLQFGDNAASDFALTSGLTTNLNPWFEIIGWNWFGNFSNGYGATRGGSNIGTNGTMR